MYAMADIEEYLKTLGRDYRLVDVKRLDAPWNSFDFVARENPEDGDSVVLIFLVDEEIYHNFLEDSQRWNRLSNLFTKYSLQDAWWSDSADKVWGEDGERYRILELYSHKGFPHPALAGFIKEFEKMLNKSTSFN